MELLKKLTECNSVSGDEKEIRELIELEAKKYAYDIRTDALGNLIVHKKGTGKKLMMTAHMDEIGIIVTFVEDDGFIRFSKVGGLYTNDLIGRRVRFKNGTVGVIGLDGEAKDRTLQKMFIDIGAKDKKSAEKMVKIGDTACFMGEFVVQGEKIISKALDDRVGCYILLEALKNCEESKNDLYFVFTVQEEVGLRGAKTSAFGIMPDMAIAIDVTDTGDTPKSDVMEVKLGAGAAIKVMDSSCICSPEVRSLLLELARKNKIPCQIEVLTYGGTDAGAIHLTGAGVKTGGVSIPTRFIHSPSEMVDADDVKACIRLVEQFCYA